MNGGIGRSPRADGLREAGGLGAGARSIAEGNGRGVFLAASVDSEGGC
jgi:hypothetical protein